MTSPLDTTDIERTFWEYDRASVSNITEVAKLRGELPLEALRSAIETVVNRHPYFRHTFSNDGRRLFSHPSALIGWSVVENAASDEWVRQVEYELHQPFDMTVLPLLRARAVIESGSQMTLLLTLPHVIAAGVGALNFAKTVLELLDARLAGSEDPTWEPLRFVRPSSDQFDPRRSQTPTWSRAEAETDSLVVQASVPDEEWSWSPIGSAHKSLRSKLHAKVLSVSATEGILARCRTDDIPFNSYFSGAAMVAADRFLRSMATPSGMKVSSAIDFREMLPQLELKPLDLGMWAGRFHLYAKIPAAADTLSVAKAFQAGIFHTLRRSAFYEIRTMAGGGTSEVPKKAPLLPSLKITNLGDLDGQGLSPPLKSFQLISLQSLTALHRGWAGPYGFGIIPSLFQGRLQLSFFSGDPGLSSEQTEDWIRTTVTALGANSVTDLSPL